VEAIGAGGLEEASAALAGGTVSPADAVGAFNSGLAVAAMRERRDATGLDRFHGEGHDVRIASFVESSGRVRTMLRESIPAVCSPPGRSAPTRCAAKPRCCPANPTSAAVR